MATSRKKQVKFGIFDSQKVERMLRKAAFCKALAAKINVKEVCDYLADFEEVDMPPPMQTRTAATNIYEANSTEFMRLSKAGETGRLREFCRSILDNYYRDHGKIKDTFRRADRYNAKILRRLTFGQYATATAGLAAGVGLIALGGGASLVLAATGGGGAAFGLTLGTAGQTMACTVATNITVSAARSWADSDNWSGVAFVSGGAGQAWTEGKRAGINAVVDKGFDRWFENCVKTFKTGGIGGKIESVFNGLAAGFSKAATVGTITVVFVGQDTANEANYFLKSIESPQQRYGGRAGSYVAP